MSTGGYPELHTWDAKGVCKNCGVNFKQVIHEQVMAVEAIRRELEAERRASAWLACDLTCSTGCPIAEPYDYDVEPWLGEKRSRLACRKQLAPLAGPNPGCAMLVLEAARDATKEAE